MWHVPSIGSSNRWGRITDSRQPCTRQSATVRKQSTGVSAKHWSSLARYCHTLPMLVPHIGAVIQYLAAFYTSPWSFSVLKLLVGQQEGHLAGQKSCSTFRGLKLTCWVTKKLPACTEIKIQKTTGAVVSHRYPTICVKALQAMKKQFILWVSNWAECRSENSQ